MKKLLLWAAAMLMMASLAACTPTATATTAETKAHSHNHAVDSGVRTDPEGNIYETEDGVADKQGVKLDEDGEMVTVLIYTLKDDKTGLQQVIEAIPGTEMDPQLILNLMAEYSVVEDGITVSGFENNEGALKMDLSSLEKKDDPMIITALANTFIGNYEAESLSLSVAGEAVSGEPLVFEKKYKEMK